MVAMSVRRAPPAMSRTMRRGTGTRRSWFGMRAKVVVQRLWLEAKLPRVGRELDVRRRDRAQEADGQEFLDGLALAPCPADKSSDFQGREFRRGIVVRAAAAAAFHFGQGEIDPQLLEANFSLPERGPRHDELRD